MSQNRYPTELPVTLDDFRSSGWESIISPLEDYLSMWTALSKAAELAISDGRLE